MEFEKEDEAKLAIKDLDGDEILGQKIGVGWAFCKSQPGGGGGGGGGRRRGR